MSKNDLVHGRIYPDDAELRTAPPTPEAVARAQEILHEDDPAIVGTFYEAFGVSLPMGWSRQVSETRIRDAVHLLRSRFIIRRR